MSEELEGDTKGDYTALSIHVLVFVYKKGLCCTLIYMCIVGYSIMALDPCQLYAQRGSGC